MGLHPEFPKSPFAEIEPFYRWFPADEDLRGKGYEKLLPPLVTKLREEIKSWRDSGYVVFLVLTRSLLNHWFLTKHPRPTEDNSEKYFQYYLHKEQLSPLSIFMR